METIVPQTEYSDSKHILEMLEDLIESVQMNIDCNDPNNSESYATLVHVRAFVRGEPVYNEPNPVSLPDLLKRAESSLEALTCKSGEIYALQTRLAEYVQGINDLADRAQASETRVRDLEDAFERAEDGHLAILRKELAYRLQQLEVYKTEADTFHKAFEIAHRRREQLYNDNCDLSSAVVDLNHINQQLTTRLTQVLDLFVTHDLLWEIRDEAGARAASEIIKAARELVGKV